MWYVKIHFTNKMSVEEMWREKIYTLYEFCSCFKFLFMRDIEFDY